MKIIHAPLEIAGQVGLICSTLGQKRIEATGYNFYPNYLNYKQVINTDAFELAKILEPAIEHYDIFHFHNSYTFLENYLDLPMIKNAGKKMIMHHRGNDVRSPQFISKQRYVNPYVNTDSSLPHEQIVANLNLFSSMMDAAIVQDAELYNYVADFYHSKQKKVYILPRLVNTQAISPAYSTYQRNRPVMIMHAPTSRAFKGSNIIESVIDQLRKELPIAYMRIEGKSHDEALSLYRQADIIIDQILCGVYGNLSIEGMALGKPVICFIRPDLKEHFPEDLPIVSANPDTLYDVLKSLVLDQDRQQWLGRQGRKYVENHHEADKVIKKLIRIYKEVLYGKE